MDVSVTIVNWNGAELLPECLHSVFATSNAVRLEVIVVDNGSTDHSAQVVATHFPRVTLVRNAHNVGYGRAQNQALARARGRYIVMLNNDAMVNPDTIPTLLDFMEQHPEVGACSCPDSRQTSLGTAYSGAFPRFPSLARTTLENLWAVLHPPRSWDIHRLATTVHRWIGEEFPEVDSLEVAWLVGALFCARKTVVEHVGGFDERFFLFDEDIDLCRRISTAGWKVVFTTRTSFAHRGGISSAWREDTESIRGMSRALYFQKYHGPLTTVAFRMQHYALRRCLLAWRRRLESMMGGTSKSPHAEPPLGRAKISLRRTE